MNNERDKPQTDEEPAGEHQAAQRRPWHAPVFMLTDIALTDAQNNGDSDASSFLS